MNSEMRDLSGKYFIYQAWTTSFGGPPTYMNYIPNKMRICEITALSKQDIIIKLSGPYHGINRTISNLQSKRWIRKCGTCSENILYIRLGQPVLGDRRHTWTIFRTKRAFVRSQLWVNKISGTLRADYINWNNELWKLQVARTQIHVFFEY